MDTGRVLGTIWHGAAQKLSCGNSYCFICRALGGVRGHRCSLAVLTCPPEKGVGGCLHLRVCTVPFF